MAMMKGLEGTFDTVASTYEKFRPGYVKELYQTIFDYIPIHEASRVIEVGIGGGQATLPFLQTGCELTAVEYGAHFSQLCREKFKDYSKFSVITGKFEDAVLEDHAFDLVFSASAFHWVPEEIGYPKVFSLLKSGGVFARFANHPYRDRGNPALAEEMDRIYARYYYKFYNRKPETPKEYSGEQAGQRASLADQYGFTDSRYAMFYRTRTFSSEEYSALLAPIQTTLPWKNRSGRSSFPRSKRRSTATAASLPFTIPWTCSWPESPNRFSLDICILKGGLPMDSFDFAVQKGSEKEKEDILTKYPHTKAVIRDGGVLMIALKQDEIIGFLWMYQRKTPAPVDQNEWFINVIDVPDAAYRRKGVGSGLVREAIDYARRDGAYQVCAYCDIANVPSHALWVRNRFSILPAYGADGSVLGSFVGFKI